MGLNLLNGERMAAHILEPGCNRFYLKISSGHGDVHPSSQQCFDTRFIRYLSFENAMKVCSELGDRKSHLVPFDGPEDFEFFYQKSRLNPAVERYCNHGDRKLFWLPYRNRYSTI